MIINAFYTNIPAYTVATTREINLVLMSTQYKQQLFDFDLHFTFVTANISKVIHGLSYPGTSLNSPTSII